MRKRFFTIMVGLLLTIGVGGQGGSTGAATYSERIESVSTMDSYPCGYTGWKCTSWKDLGFGTQCRGFAQLLKSGSYIYSTAGSQCNSKAVSTQARITLFRGSTEVATHLKTCYANDGSYYCWSNQVKAYDTAGSHRYCGSAHVIWPPKTFPNGDIANCAYY